MWVKWQVLRVGQKRPQFSQASLAQGFSWGPSQPRGHSSVLIWGSTRMGDSLPSLLTWLLAGFSSSWSFNWGPQFLTMLFGLHGTSYNMALFKPSAQHLTERKRDGKREHSRWCHSLYIIWFWMWYSITSMVFYYSENTC